MRSLRSMARFARIQSVCRALTVVALAAASALSLPQARAGGLLVSDGHGVYRYSAITGSYISHLTPPGGGMGSPMGLAARPDGTVLVASLGTNSIRRHNSLTGEYLGDFVASNSGGLNQPHGLAFGPDGSLYVCSSAGNAILRYDGQTGAFQSAFVPAGSGGLSEPWGIAFGPDGHLYVSSVGTNSILRYDGQTGAFLGAFVPASSGGLSRPKGLAFGSDGNLYVSSYLTDQVLRYNGQTGAFMNIFSEGQASQGGDLQRPTGLGFAANGELYVCSLATSSVLRFSGQTGAFQGIMVTPASGGLGQPHVILFAQPTPPGSLSATRVAANKVDLAWADNSDDETAFAIWRRVGSGEWIRIKSVVPNATRYSDLDVNPATGYTYRVRAISGSGASAWSNEVTLVPSTPPAAPANLTASAASTTQVNLTWQDKSNNEKEFVLLRKTGNGLYARVAVLPPNMKSYIDTTADPNTTYTYIMRAVNEAGVSAWTNESSVTTPNGPPVAPANLSARGASSTQINLAWTDKSSNETEFAILRKTGNGVYARIAVVPANTTSYADTTVSPNTTYSYIMRAVNGLGGSGWSNEVTAAPGVGPTAPANLTATVVSVNQVNLTWQDKSSNETQFVLLRKIGSGLYARIAVVGANTTSYTDTTVSGGVTYTYIMRAVNGAGFSAWTNEPSVTTP